MFSRLPLQCSEHASALESSAEGHLMTAFQGSPECAITFAPLLFQEMNAKYEAGKAEANATLEAQRVAAADAQAAITQAAEAKLKKLQLQV